MNPEQADVDSEFWPRFDSFFDALPLIEVDGPIGPMPIHGHLRAMASYASFPDLILVLE